MNPVYGSGLPLSAVDITQKWDAPNWVVGIFLFVWVMAALFIARAYLKNRRP
jgi:hypothetical protein